MRIFIAGDKGQLGRSLRATLVDHTLSGCDLPELDITDQKSISAAIVAFAPDVVIHAAAWTDVDACAREPERAHRVNALGTRNIAQGCAACDAAMVYLSTNEVFDGNATEPYQERDPINPINPYAQSKAAGESFVRDVLKRFYVVRTAWLYAAGGRNFPHRIVELADERGSLKVVTDEVSNPTYAPDLARGLSALIQSEAWGTYHLVNTGHCSRYEFAREILRISERKHVAVEQITRDDFQRASTPPRFAPLANTAAAALGIELRPWQEALAEFLRHPI